MAEHVEPILRRPRVEEATGLSRSTIYLRISQGLWPRPVSLGGGRAVGWPQSEVAALNRAFIAGKSAAEIRKLVVQLHSARTATPHIAEHEGGRV